MSSRENWTRRSSGVTFLCGRQPRGRVIYKITKFRHVPHGCCKCSTLRDFPRTDSDERGGHLNAGNEPLTLAETVPSFPLRVSDV